MKTYRALIVEDEKKARNFLRKLIETECPFLEVVGESGTIEESIEQIDALAPDILFLDIQLGDRLSFEILRKVDFEKLKIIFVTAYEQYAMEAFRFSAVDYLHKPIDPDLLVKAVDKAVVRLDERRSKLELEVLIHNFSAKPQDRKLVLNTMDAAHVINLSEIIFCQSEGNYTRFFLEKEKQILTSKTLKEYEIQFGNAGFMRVHKSFLINLEQLRTFNKKEGGLIIMKDGSKIPLAVRKKEAFLNTFSQWQ
ncbi:MAG: LytTR family DNA-binding domain-containing protein [Bacteroidota bacterium]